MVVQEVSNLGNGSDGGDSAASHDRDMIGELFQLLQLMAGNDQALLLSGQLLEEDEELLAANRINAAQRFIENQQLGIVDEGLGQLDPLPHAFGVAGETSLRTAGHADHLQTFAGSASSLRPGVTK